MSQAESGFSGTQTCSVFQPRAFFYHETFCLETEVKPFKLTTFPLSTSSLFGSFLLLRCFDRLRTALYQPRHRQQSQDDGHGGGVCNHDSLLLQTDSLRHSEPRVFGGKQKVPTTKSRADPVSQLDIEGLNITVTSAGKAGVKAKGKARAEGLEILSNATLKLKAGVCYALVGRNGTGKSSKFIVDLAGLAHAMKSLDLGHSTDSSNSSPESCC